MQQYAVGGRHSGFQMSSIEDKFVLLVVRRLYNNKGPVMPAPNSGVKKKKKKSAFDNRKSLLCYAPVLAACLTKHFKVQTDVSHVREEAVLLKEKVWVHRSVCCFSRKLIFFQQVSYPTFEKEVFAPLSTCWLSHNPLTFLGSLNCPNQRLNLVSWFDNILALMFSFLKFFDLQIPGLLNNFLVVRYTTSCRSSSSDDNQAYLKNISPKIASIHLIIVFVQQILFFFVLVHRAIHMHDVRMDQLVSLQCVLWDGDEIQGAIHQTVSRRQFFVSTPNRRD